MRSLVHLFNTSLARLGGEQIPQNISPIESDANGAVCRNVFPHVLDSTLAAYEWSFAKKRVALALLPEREPDGRTYRFRYAAPPDCLRTIRIVPPACAPRGAREVPASFEVEGTAVLSNMPEATLLYVARIEEPKLWPPAFADALAWALAGELASIRINDSRKQQWCYQNYEIALAKACAQDKAIQNPARGATPWQTARRDKTGSPLSEWRW